MYLQSNPNQQPSPLYPLPENENLTVIKPSSGSNVMPTLKQAWSHKAGKIIIIGGSALALLAAVGVLFRLLAWTRRGYKDFRNSGKP